VERQYGDLIRIDNDASFGTWLLLSGLRETWQPIWSQWQNPFQGFTGFSDVSDRVRSFSTATLSPSALISTTSIASPPSTSS